MTSAKMKFLNAFSLALLATGVTARNSQHVGKKQNNHRDARAPQQLTKRGNFPRSEASKYNTSATQRK